MSQTATTASPRIVLNRVVLSYPRLFVPSQIMGQGEPFYSCTLLLDRKTNAADIKAAIEAATAAANKTWPNGSWKAKRDLHDEAEFHWPIGDGNRKKDRNGYEGKVFINARSKQRPTVVDQNVQKVLDDTLIYPGVIANVSISFFGYFKPRMGVGVGLNNVQIVADGERLGGRPAAEDDFTPIDRGEANGPDPWLS